MRALVRSVEGISRVLGLPFKYPIQTFVAFFVCSSAYLKCQTIHGAPLTRSDLVQLSSGEMCPSRQEKAMALHINVEHKQDVGRSFIVTTRVPLFLNAKDADALATEWRITKFWKDFTSFEKRLYPHAYVPAGYEIRSFQVTVIDELPHGVREVSIVFSDDHKRCVRAYTLRTAFIVETESFWRTILLNDDP